MNLFNGAAEFYRIEGRSRWRDKDHPSNWCDVVGDHYGHPNGMTASDPVWQKYGVFGTEDIGIAEHALKLLIENFPETDFRIVKTMVMMSTTVVGKEHLSDNPVKPPTTRSYPDDEHYEHKRRVAGVCEYEPVGLCYRWLE